MDQITERHAQALGLTKITDLHYDLPFEHWFLIWQSDYNCWVLMYKGGDLFRAPVHQFILRSPNEFKRFASAALWEIATISLPRK